jgi:hypothetical protein
MRSKSKNIFPAFFDNESPDEKANKNVQHYRDLYKTFDEYLKKYPEIEQLAHEELQTLCKKDPTRERTPDFTTQNLFRAVLVTKMEGLDFRAAEVVIAESRTLQNSADSTKKKRSAFNSSTRPHARCHRKPGRTSISFSPTAWCKKKKSTPTTSEAMAPLLKQIFTIPPIRVCVTIATVP